LAELCRELTSEYRRGPVCARSSDFENRVRHGLQSLLDPSDLKVDFQPHPYAFPDIVVGECGVEVKFTTNDTWRTVANSVLESFRSENVEEVYVVFGKMGGVPAVRWARYDDCVIHVRTSHVPRFEVQIPDEGAPGQESLFHKFGVTYKDFCRLSLHDRMEHVRRYARSRLKRGERLWWLEDRPEVEHSLPIQARLYTTLSREEKRTLRAEAALLCPEVVKSPGAKHKYDDATLYLLTYHGVLCHQLRDLFTAGSVAGPERGGNYMLRALRDIEPEMRSAAETLDDSLFVDYWGRSVRPADRIREWLKRADDLATTWKPSEELFLEHH